MKRIGSTLFSCFFLLSLVWSADPASSRIFEATGSSLSAIRLENPRPVMRFIENNPRALIRVEVALPNGEEIIRFVDSRATIASPGDALHVFPKTSLNVGDMKPRVA
jgi:hypothetical protein